MKKIYVLLLAAVAAMPSMAQNETKEVVADFENVENATFNADGYSYGKDTGEKKTDQWGSSNDLYNIVEGPFTLETLYNPAYGSWSGYTLSQRTDTTFVDYTLGQYNNINGCGADSSKTFVVVYGTSDGSESPKINVAPNTTVQGFYVTNSAYTYNSISKGDSFAKGLTKEGDFFKVTAVGKKDGAETARVDIDLAKFTTSLEYISDWTWVDLSNLGEVDEISFVFAGSDSGAYGLNTPVYFCFDNLTATTATTDGIQKVNDATDAVEVARYSLNGQRLSAPQKGINIVKYSNGMTKKVFVK